MLDCPGAAICMFVKSCRMLYCYLHEDFVCIDMQVFSKAFLQVLISLQTLSRWTLHMSKAALNLKTSDRPACSGG